MFIRDSPLIVTIECKHTTKGPWVGVMHETAARRSEMQPSAALALGDDATMVSDLAFATLQHPDPPCGGIYLAAGRGSDRNTAYDATRQALAAARAVGLARLNTGTDPDSLQDRLLGGVLALVVTTAPLFRARLAPGGELALQQVDELEVMTESLSGSHSVTVLTRAGLSQWASKLGQHWAPARV